MHRHLTLNDAMDLAHRIAEKHVARHQKPNRTAWYQEWDAFCGKTSGKYTDLDLQIICTYAEAALRYDSKHYQPNGKPCGLWVRQWSNVSEAESEAA